VWIALSNPPPLSKVRDDGVYIFHSDFAGLDLDCGHDPRVPLQSTARKLNVPIGGDSAACDERLRCIVKGVSYDSTRFATAILVGEG
jgi:hypothetical protein